MVSRGRLPSSQCKPTCYWVPMIKSSYQASMPLHAAGHDDHGCKLQHLQQVYGATGRESCRKVTEVCSSHGFYWERLRFVFTFRCLWKKSRGTMLATNSFDASRSDIASGTFSLLQQTDFVLILFPMASASNCFVIMTLLKRYVHSMLGSAPIVSPIE